MGYSFPREITERLTRKIGVHFATGTKFCFTVAGWQRAMTHRQLVDQIAVHPSDDSRTVLFYPVDDVFNTEDAFTVKLINLTIDLRLEY